MSSISTISVRKFGGSKDIMDMRFPTFSTLGNYPLPCLPSLLPLRSSNNLMRSIMVNLRKTSHLPNLFQISRYSTYDIWNKVIFWKDGPNTPTQNTPFSDFFWKEFRWTSWVAWVLPTCLWRGPPASWYTRHGKRMLKNFGWPYKFL